MSLPSESGAASWVDTANQSGNGFPLQWLPYCAFTPVSASGPAPWPDLAAPMAEEPNPRLVPHLGVGIGALILDLHKLQTSGLLSDLPANLQSACRSTHLNEMMSCGPGAWSALRGRLIDLLKAAEPRSSRNQAQRRLVASLMTPAAQAVFHKPVWTENYTDFYASLHHARNVGRLFRPDEPLLPNYPWLPIGYHGRASSLMVSGTPVRRPHGQCKAGSESAPVFQPSTRLDYELEVAAYVGVGNPLGSRIPIEQAAKRLFGLSLLNDWSARDIQSWEYQPLGPFLGKSFATSVSPWVVPMDALAPYRARLTPRSASEPAPLAYLAEPDANLSGLDITVETYLSTEQMRARRIPALRLSRANLRDLYWSFAQMLTHQTSNGCNLKIGDILASGTISGEQPGSQGCLLEMTKGGEVPLCLPTGERRTFLEDGDEVSLRGYGEREGLPMVSMGECRGRVLSAIE